MGEILKYILKEIIDYINAIIYKMWGRVLYEMAHHYINNVQVLHTN